MKAWASVCLIGIAAGIAAAAGENSPEPHYSVERGELPLNFTTLKRMVYYSYIAYCHEGAIEDYSCAYCGEDAKGLELVHYSYDSGSKTAGIVGINHMYKEIVIAFRGTLPYIFTNYIDDIDFWAKFFPLPFAHRFNGNRSIENAQVHSGFYDAYKPQADEVVAAYFDLTSDYPDYTIYMTGHSMGAALATLFLMDIAFQRDVPLKTDQMWLITFGMPRLGNPDFADAFIETGVPSLRFTHNNDFVPHLPKESWGFKHIPQEIWEKDGLSFTVCDKSGEDPTCSNSNWFDVSLPNHISYFDIYFLTCGLWAEA